jgi:transcriptional regulator with XRE-family HTH domain
MNAEQLKLKFGNTLKELRKNKSMSQEQLAHDCGLDRTYISMLERGKYQPSLHTLFTIAENLEMKASDLVKLIEE